MTESANTQESLVSHLIELRDRLIKVLLGIGVVLLALFPFANQLYSLLAEPLLKHLPAHSTMVAIDVASPFLTPFKLVMLLAVVITIPWILYQLWAFVAPGLYKHERRWVFPLLASSSILFYVGMTFAYFIVFPLVFGFFTAATPEGVSVMTDISRYLDFVTKMFIAFGIAFEVPVITFVLVMTGVTNVEALARARSYVIVMAFVVGMLLTPPDVISQVLLAVPVWLLFELGLVMAKLIKAPAISAHDDNRFRPMTEQEMDQELDEIELLESEQKTSQDTTDNNAKE